MLIKEVLYKISNNEKVTLDESISLDELLEVLAHPNSQYVENLYSLIKSYFYKGNPTFLKDLEIKAKNDSSFRENVINFLEIPEKIERSFSYTNFKLNLKEDLPQFSKYQLTYETEKSLPSLYYTGESEGSFSFHFKLDPNSLFLYIEEPQNLLEQSLFDKFVSNNQDVIKAAASMAAGALVVGTFFFGSKANARMDIGPEKAIKVNIETLNFMNIDGDISESIESLESSKDPQAKVVIDHLNSISFKELEKMTKFESSNLSESEEKEMIIESILGLYKDDNPQRYKKIKPHITRIVESVFSESSKRNLDPKILLSIIKTESDFDQQAVSSTQDLSLAQINVEQWDKEFQRLKRKPIDKEKIKTDESYSISRMAEILEILNKRHPKDPLWYARYHSSTPSRKIAYAQKVNNSKSYFETYELNQIKEKITLAIFLINNIKNDENRESLTRLSNKLILIANYTEEQLKSNLVALND